MNFAYGASVQGVAGTVAAQNIASIENPIGSTLTVFVQQIQISCSAVATSAIAYQYLLTRASALPSAGTPAVAQQFERSFPPPQAIVRSSPTAEAAPGSLFACAGLTSPDAPSSGLDMIPTFASSAYLIIAPGDALLVVATGNDVDLRHTVSFYWEETNG